MVQEYAEHYYLPMYQREIDMMRPSFQTALDYAAWRYNVAAAWSQVAVRHVSIPVKSVKVGQQVEVTAVVNLGKLTPSDVRVQLYIGRLNTDGTFSADGEAIDMKPSGSGKGSEYTFTTTVNHTLSGERGISVRVVPHHQYMSTDFQSGLITWA